MKKVLKMLFLYIFPLFSKTAHTAAPITFGHWLKFKLGLSKTYWPVHKTSVISNYKNIIIGIGTAPGLSPGCYIQGIGEIYLGDYTIVAPNVGIISANHDNYDIRKHNKKSVNIGKYCWIGMNSTIMPGVVLGDHTIVAANTVVTKSFEQGFCIIGGVPAKIIKQLDKTRVVNFEHLNKFHGFIPANNFAGYREKNLNV